MEDFENLIDQDFESSNFLFPSVDGYDRDISDFAGFLFVQVNARSISNINRFDKLKFALHKLPRKPDVLVVSETWVSVDLVQLYDIDGYESTFSCRKDGRGGGLAVFVLKKLNFSIINSSEIVSANNSINFIQIKIFSDNDKSLLVSSYYRPPDDSILTDFFNHLESTLSSSNSLHILVGDINIDTKSSSTKLNDYLNILSSFGFSITNTNITRPSSNSIIDHVAFNYTEHFSIINDTIHNPDSDHNFIVTLVPFSPHLLPNTPKFKQHINYCRLEQLLELRFNPTYMGNYDDPNEFYNYFLSTLNRTLTECTTQIELKSKPSEICPWMTDGLKTLLNSSKNLRKKRKKFVSLGKNTDNIDIKIQNLTERIQNYNDTLNKKYYINKFANAKNTKEIWNNINNVLGRNKKFNSPSEMTQTLPSGQQVKISEKQEIVNEFNNYFTSIGEQMAQKIVINPNDDINKFETLKRSQRTFFLNPTNETEIENLINSFSNNTASGFDKISAFLLKKLSHVVSPILSNIFNLCMSQGIYPDKLKIARVTPVFKAGSPSLFNNYRPISVLSVLNKIFEKILFNRLTIFLNSNNFLCPQQYGFREKSSTSNAVIDLVNKIQLDLDNRDDVLGLFLDLSKAFDTVDRKILIDKLRYAGVRGIALDLFTSYLSNRAQFVCIDGIHSLLTLVNVGVPQGSVLGPLFFIIYLNDFSLLPLKGDLRLFADDSSLFYNNKSTNMNDLNLRDDLTIVIEYFRLNKLTLNINKTNIINIKNSSRSIPNSLSLTTSKFPDLEVVSDTKYLGIILDNRLNWSAHINALILKLHKITGIIFKIKHKLPQKVLFLIYHSLFHSILSYVTAVWGNACGLLINKLQVAQNRILKIILNLPIRSHTVDLYVKNNILPVRGIYVFQVCSFIYLCLNNKTHSNTKFVRSNHQYGTRYHDLLNRPNVTTVPGERSINFNGAQLYNYFNNRFGKSSSLNIFKNQLKQCLSRPDIIEKLLKSVNIFA